MGHDQAGHGGHGHTPEVHGHADEWHHHEAAEGEPQRENASSMNTRNVAISFVVLCVTIGGVVLALVMLFDSYSTTTMARLKETTQSSQEYLTYRASAERVLGMGGQAGEYNWAGAAGGGEAAGEPAVQIPIDAAKRKVIEQYQKVGR